MSAAQVRASLGAHRNKIFDALVMMSFAGIYTLVTKRFVRGIWTRFPPGQDRTLGILSTIIISPIASLLGVLIGGWWSWYAETLRIGYGHLVERSERIPWYHNLSAVFVAGVALFLIMSLLHTGRRGPKVLGLPLCWA